MIKIGGIELDDKMVLPAILVALAVGMFLGSHSVQPEPWARECRQRLKECQEELDKCKKGLKRAKTVAVLLPIASVVLQIPGAIKDMKDIGFVSWLLDEKDKEIDTDSPLDYINDNQRNQLDNLAKRSWEIEQDAKYGEVEKNEFRRQILSETCGVLGAWSRIRDEIRGYSKLVGFCASFSPLRIQHSP